MHGTATITEEQMVTILPEADASRQNNGPAGASPCSDKIAATMGHDPVVFISSTSDDLSQHREQAREAALMSGFSPRMMEYLPASGHITLSECRKLVAEAEVVVVLVAHRYGWVPDGPDNPERKRITWLECEHAWKVTGKHVIAFLVDPEYAWPAEFRENYRLVTEKNKRGIRGEVQRNEKNLNKFKQELSKCLRGTFTDASTVRPLVLQALANWKAEHSAKLIQAPTHTDTYLTAVEQKTRSPSTRPVKVIQFGCPMADGSCSTRTEKEYAIFTGNQLAEAHRMFSSSLEQISILRTLHPMDKVSSIPTTRRAMISGSCC